MRPRDSQRSKVYKAENMAFCADNRERHESVEAVITRLNSWISQSWFRSKWQVRKVGVYDGRGSRRAKFLRNTLLKIGDELVLCAVFSFPKWSRMEWVMIHELAHAVTPGHVAAHGREFCQNYLLLVRHYLGAAAERRLKIYFRKHRVKYKPKRVMTEEQRARLAARAEIARAAIARPKEGS